jgi:hypothetical protein
LTADNFTSPRILFEAGALARTNAHVGTFLLDPPRGAIGQPLGHFHHTLYEKDDLRRLLVMVNAKVIASGERGLTELMLSHSFDAWWPRLRQKLDSILEVTAPAPALIEGREFSSPPQTAYSDGTPGQL